MQVYPKGDSTPRGVKKMAGEEDKMAKLLRERSTAQKRRQCKREELTTLGNTVAELEATLAKIQAQIESLTPSMRAHVLAAQARAGVPPWGCRLCCILERADEYTTVEKLLQHFRMHHGTETRNRRDDMELIRFGTEIPAEDAEGSENDSDSDDEIPDLAPSTSPDPATSSSSPDLIGRDLKRKMRLKRNAASARKSRKRKRVQLERWRMMLPMLKFQVATLERALGSVVAPPPPQIPAPPPRPLQHPYEPDVISAAFALIGCSLSAQKTSS